MTTYQNRVIALAGVCQASHLISNIARKGMFDAEMFENSINSILITDPQFTADVFNGSQNIQHGLKLLAQLLNGNKQPKDMDVFRYSMSCIGLSLKMLKMPQVLNNLGARIEQIKRQVEHFPITESQMISNLAAIYSDLLSPISSKIQVAGTPANLQIQANQDKIRALLLAGIRAAVLWRQNGGSRTQFFFSRKKMLEAIYQLK